MSILVKGMKMPTDGLMIFAIRPDGMVEDVMGCVVGEAVPVPPHGRLGDLDELYAYLTERYQQNRGNLYPTEAMYIRAILARIADAPTIIPAEEGEA